MKRRGKKTIAWEKERAKLKVRFEAAGVTSCELQWPGCLHASFLSFAHAKRRRFLKPHELGIVILACQNCHDILDHKMSHEAAEEIVLTVIQNRQRRAHSVLT